MNSQVHTEAMTATLHSTTYRDYNGNLSGAWWIEYQGLFYGIAHSRPTSRRLHQIVAMIEDGNLRGLIGLPVDSYSVISSEVLEVTS
jgi:hypothetical protein